MAIDNVKKEQLEKLEELVSNFIMKKITRDHFEKGVSILLKELHDKKDKTFAVSIIDCSRNKEDFFAFRIYPILKSENELFDSIIGNQRASFSEILNKWKNIQNWYIEIDSRVFDRLQINFTPQEIVACLLHEVGHTLYEDTTVERFYNAYLDLRSKIPAEEKSTTKLLYQLYQLPLFISCGLHKLRVGKNEINVEIFADSTLELYGYAEHLISALQKIIRTYGNTIFQSNKQIEGAINQEMRWCHIGVANIIERRDRLKSELYYRLAKTNSGYVKRTILSIMQTLGISMKHKYSGNISAALESLLDSDPTQFLSEYELIYDLDKIGILMNRVTNAKQSVAVEAYNRSKQPKKPKLPTQLDIDSIAVEVDRITNHADRRYVLDLIFNQVTKIEECMDLIEDYPQLKDGYRLRADSMLKELQELRARVLAKRSFNKQYKVFVKYPEDYEG